MSNPFNTRSVPKTNVNMGQIKQIYNLLRNSNNPNQLIEQMIAKNPQLSPTLNLIRSNGNYEQIFRDMCRERGIDADDFIRQMNS